MARKTLLLGFILLMLATSRWSASVQAQNAGPDLKQFPRIGCLWGCYAQDVTQYDIWARYDLVVMNGRGVENYRKARAELRKLNPNILMLPSTSFLVIDKTPEECTWATKDMYLRNDKGEALNMWAGQIFVGNLTRDDYYDALMKHVEEDFGQILDEGLIDGLMFDCVLGNISQMFGGIDADLDGQADDPVELNKLWHARQLVWFDRLRERWPGLIIMGNDVDFGHTPGINGRLYESGKLLGMVDEQRMHPAEAIDILNYWGQRSLTPPATLVHAGHPIGWEFWRVGSGDKVTTTGELERIGTNYKTMRQGLMITLMSDVYFGYDVGTILYGIPYDYAEYHAPLGRAKGQYTEHQSAPPETVLEWKAGDDPTLFLLDQNVKATAEGVQAQVDAPGSAFNRLLATNPKVLQFEPGQTYRIEAECEITQMPTFNFQFCARTLKGSGPYTGSIMEGNKDPRLHDKGYRFYEGELGSHWTIKSTFIPDSFDDYSLQWLVRGPAGVRVTKLRVQRMGDLYYSREFEGGMALLNGTAKTVTIPLDKPMHKLSESTEPGDRIKIDWMGKEIAGMRPAPRYYDEIDNDSERFEPYGPWRLNTACNQKYGDSYMSSITIGPAAAAPAVEAKARWHFTAPADDTYTFYANVPADDDLTTGATYTLMDLGSSPTITVDQSKGDNNWVELFQQTLAAGQNVVLELATGATGRTAADAARMESSRLYNDGSRVESVQLEPFDGIILLYEQGADDTQQVN